MGTYLNPPLKAKEGRKLPTGDFATMVSHLREGEVLVGLYDRLIFKLAVYLPDSKEMENFESQYRRGEFISHDFYAVPGEWL